MRSIYPTTTYESDTPDLDNDEDDPFNDTRSSATPPGEGEESGDERNKDNDNSEEATDVPGDAERMSEMNLDAGDSILDEQERTEEGSPTLSDTNPGLPSEEEPTETPRMTDRKSKRVRGAKKDRTRKKGRLTLAGMNLEQGPRTRGSDSRDRHPELGTGARTSDDWSQPESYDEGSHDSEGMTQDPDPLLIAAKATSHGGQHNARETNTSQSMRGTFAETPTWMTTMTWKRTLTKTGIRTVMTHISLPDIAIIMETARTTDETNSGTSSEEELNEHCNAQVGGN